MRASRILKRAYRRGKIADIIRENSSMMKASINKMEGELHAVIETLKEQANANKPVPVADPVLVRSPLPDGRDSLAEKAERARVILDSAPVPTEGRSIF